MPRLNIVVVRVFAAVCLCLGLGACNDQSDWRFQEGTILQRDLTSNDLWSPNLLLSTDNRTCPTAIFFLDEGTSYVPFGTQPQSLTVGAKIRVWYGGVINEICPVMTPAYKVELIPGG